MMQICIAIVSGMIGGCIGAAIWMHFETRKAIMSRKKIEEQLEEMHSDIEMQRLN